MSNLSVYCERCNEIYEDCKCYYEYLKVRNFGFMLKSLKLKKRDYHLIVTIQFILTILENNLYIVVMKISYIL